MSYSEAGVEEVVVSVVGSDGKDGIVQLESGNDVVRSLCCPCQPGVVIFSVCCPLEELRVLPAQGTVGWDQDPGCAKSSGSSP